MKTSPFCTAISLENPIVFGYSQDFPKLYEVGPILGKGGFGVVEQVTKKETGEVFACKRICKNLTSTVATPTQRKRHLENLQREIAVLRTLKGSLNIATLEGVFEDEQFVYIVMECCFGGELLHTIGLRPYSESTVSRIMRAVLRTLAQCHERNILHRDIKPGNFMFLKDDAHSPIKAIDFGLAVFSEGPDIPRTDLGFDGTPWFMAPEVLSSKVVPASDVWSAGVMAYQLLSGLLPFDDKKCRHAPALSAVWKSVLSDEPDFSRKCWKEVSAEAQDFIKSVLKKDPKQRPTALEALSHPWLKKDRKKDSTQKSLSHTIVQRIQRFGQSSLFKRTVLDMIANELLQSYIEKTLYNAKKLKNKTQETQGFDNAQGGGSEYSQSKAIGILNSIQHRRNWKSYTDLSRVTSASLEDWQEAKKASRLALDTSSHGSESFNQLLDHSQSHSDAPMERTVHFKDLEIARSPSTVAQEFQSVLEQDSEDSGLHEESTRRGKSFYKDYIQSQGLLLQEPIEETEPVTTYSFDPKSIRIEQFMRSVFGIQDAKEINKVMEFLNIGTTSDATPQELINGLGKLGYDVDEHEINCLLDIISPGGDGVNFTQFVASQIDWDSVQENHKETWLECVKLAFKAIDKDQDGMLSTSDLIEAIGEKLPNKDDIDGALDQARAEACAAELDMNFEEFLTLLTGNSNASPLTRFDSRYHSTSSVDD